MTIRWTEKFFFQEHDTSINTTKERHLSMKTSKKISKKSPAPSHDLNVSVVNVLQALVDDDNVDLAEKVLEFLTMGGRITEAEASKLATRFGF